MVPLNADFREICQHIVSECKTLTEWANNSGGSDRYQLGWYTGGFDAIENEFTFSVDIGDQTTYFQLALEQLPDVISGKITEVEGIIG